VERQLYRFNVLHGVVTKQSTTFTVLVAAETICCAVPKSFSDVALSMFLVTADDRLELGRGVTTTLTLADEDGAEYTSYAITVQYPVYVAVALPTPRYEYT